MRNWIWGILALIALSAAPARGWEHWGGDRGGSRFASLDQMTSANVGSLIEAWHFQTGDLLRRTAAEMARTKFEATPLLANTSRAVHRVTLIPRAEAQNYEPPAGADFGAQRAAPFAMMRALVTSPLGMPCNKPPWGAMVAVDLKAGKVLWESSVGTIEDIAPLGLARPTGTPLVNGLLATRGGVIFTGAMDAYLRAFDAKTGAELWQGRLPVPGIANPMTYAVDGQQHVVIAAGGHSESGTSIGDSVVAFRLPRDGETPSLRSLYIDRPGGRLRAGVIAVGAVLVLLLAAAVSWRGLRKARA